MERYELVEKGQSNVKLTSNKVKGVNTIKIYKIALVNTTLTATDITPANPNIYKIANDSLIQYLLTMPNEDCYVCCLLNDVVQFFRVGAPTLRIFSYHVNANKTINYKLMSFTGTTVSSGVMNNLGHGIYYMTPSTVGDYVFQCDGTKPIAVHTPYVVDTVGMSGKIIFQKDKWMMLAVPKDNTKISDLCATIEAKYGVPASTIFRIFNAYPAAGSQTDEMLDYKPNYTPNNTKYNFSLVYSDGTAKEITGFWCRTLNYTVNNNANELVTYEWTA